MADQVENIKDALRKVLQLIVQRGKPLSKEMKAMLLEVTQHLSNRITELRQQEQIPVETRMEAPPIPVGAELLWILAGGQEDAFVNYLRTYPDPSLNSLLSNPEMLKSTIERLNKTLPQGARGSEGGIPEAPIDSSNVYGYQYDPKSGALKVRFQSGSVYAYQGVPPAVFNVFKQGAVPAKTDGQNRYGRWWRGKIPSLGAAFYQLIRSGGYPYARVS